MFNNSEVQNILGTLYASGTILFHPFESKIYTPVSNRVKCIDLKNNVTSVLNFEANRGINLMAMNPQGSILVICDFKNNLMIYNVLADFIIGRIGFKNEVRAIEFSADGKLFAVGQERGFRVYLAPPFWRTLQPLVLIKKYVNRHANSLTGIRFSPDSRFLLTHGREPKVYLNNVMSLGRGFTAPSFDVHKYPIVDTFFENDQMKHLYTLDKGGNLFVWKWVEDKSEAYNNRMDTIRRKLNKRRGKNTDAVKNQHDSEQSEDQEQVHPDVLEIQPKEDAQVDDRLYSEFESKALLGRFIIAKKLIVSQPHSQVTHCKYIDKINLLVTGHTSGRFAVWKLEADELVQVYSYSSGSSQITSLTISPDGHWIVLGIEQNGQLIVWEWRSQTYIINQSGRLVDEVCSEISPNHNFIAVGTQFGKVRVFDRVTGFCLATLAEQHEAEVSAVKFSNPTTLFSSSLDGTVQAYDLNKYKRFRVFRPDKKSQLTCLALDQSGQMVCAGSFDHYEVYCWNIQTARMLQVVTGHTAPITCIAFVGEQLFSGSWDRQLRVHEFFARKMNTETLDHGSEITCIATHPFKNQIAVSTLRGQVYIWKVPDTSEMVGILDCQSHWKKVHDPIPITSITYSPDGKYLAVAGKSKDLLIFQIKYRMMIRRILLTNNTDFKGVQEFLNSKMIRQGVNISDIRVYDDDDRLPEHSLPGSKKLDISKQEKQLEVSVHSLCVSDNNFYVGTSFGLVIFGAPKKFKFSPAELTQNATPERMLEALRSHDYTMALTMALGLRIPINKLLRKIPKSVIPKTIDQLGDKFRQSLVQAISNNQMDELNLEWLKCLLNYTLIIPRQILVKFERVRIISNLVKKSQAILQAGALLKYDTQPQPTHGVLNPQQITN